jgi:hypothetical protein
LRCSSLLMGIPARREKGKMRKSRRKQNLGADRCRGDCVL